MYYAYIKLVTIQILLSWFFYIDSYGVPKKEIQTILLCICTKSIWWNCVQKTNQEVYVAQQKNDALSFNKKGKGKFI